MRGRTRSQQHRCLECLQALAREGVREVASRSAGMLEELKCTLGLLHLKRGGTARAGQEPFINSASITVMQWLQEGLYT